MTPQAGICAEPNLHAFYLMFNLIPGQQEQVRLALAELPVFWQHTAEQYPEADFSGLVAIGNRAWDDIYPQARPDGLTAFPAQTQGARQAPETPYDLFFQFRADRLDVAYIASQQVMGLLAGLAELVYEQQGFRYLDSRDFTGFVDGTENPQDEHRAEVALLSEGRFAGGSYLHVQHYRHRMAKWRKLSVRQQEDVYGRSKLENIEYESAQKPLTAHTKRTSLKDEQGQSMEILRQSMPWGNATSQGLVFISCCNTPLHFTRMLESMFQGDGAGHFDHLTLFTQAETGSAFFAPSLEWLVKSGEL